MSRKTFSHENHEKFAAQVRNRTTNDGAVIENALAHMTDSELEEDVRQFAESHLRSVPYETILRAARVAKDKRIYDEVAARPRFNVRGRLPVHLTPEERDALCREKNVTFSEKGMRIVIATVSLAALLQGFVQSSFNGASLYAGQWGLTLPDKEKDITGDVWRLGAANSSPWFFAALVGCPLSLPINYWFGRRGAITTAAFLILASSIGAIFATNWVQLLCVRIVNGLGMGIKAVSTPILASETAVGYWRGSAILAWQLWVAFGIMLGFSFNMIYTNASSPRTTLALIQESPRYHLMKGPNYSVEEAYRVLLHVRNTQLQALRDLYLVHKALEQERVGISDWDPQNAALSPGFVWVTRDFFTQFKQLFQQRRLYNALISASTVNLAQQLCGVNVLAFYSGNIFNPENKHTLEAMAYSLGFGAINFLFALPAIKSIDTLGRRKWLLTTLPFMSLFMLGAGLAGLVNDAGKRRGLTALFFYLFAVAYSPGLGPIPFTLASESFPLSHREAGTACAISTNLFFAGLLSIFYPSIDGALGQVGSLGLFSGLNIVALALVFLFVEETKRRSLEELDHIFAVSKRKFMRFQITEHLPWLMRRYLFGAQYPRPELYRDLIWGPADEEELSSQLDIMSYMGRQDQASPTAMKSERGGAGRGQYAVEIDDGHSRYPPPRVPFARDWS
ncbi:sugar transporter domain-containing protein [Hirsutella rhossiliensis]|uniref:Sugar transporter domain-containing protein n=1 Tax=Hirsutella rhossiliensis TaxID=111463 RepID=A0A9P8MQT0_9HYPO|nr:sugar transporter domain-containing protein [Hirsutella rhossiliensis]KAH0959732.1 sugar transporter domain-containing protein [Hirsutella rhossiliensis]